MFKRIIGDIVLFLGIFFLPWWGTVLLAFVFMILFKNFWEGVGAMFIIDVLYSLPFAKFTGHFGLFTGSSLILLLIIEKLKTRIRL